MRSFQLLPFVLCALPLVSFPTAARAEAGAPPPPSCQVSASPQDNALIPANAPVPFALSSHGVRPRSITITSVTPKTTFTAKPATNDVTWYVPDAPLAENTTYKITWAVDCPVAPGTLEQPTEITFHTSTNVDLPTTIGTASVGRAFADVRVDVRLSPRLVAYLSLATFEVGVGEEVLWRGGSGSSSSTQVFTVSASQACGQQRAVDLDRPITIRASILGASTDPPPLTVMAHFACSQLEGPGTHGDAGYDDPSDAGPGDPGATNGENVAANSCACQTPTSARLAFGPFVLAIVGIGLVRRRSRNRG